MPSPFPGMDPFIEGQRCMISGYDYSLTIARGQAAVGSFRQNGCDRSWEHETGRGHRGSMVGMVGVASTAPVDLRGGGLYH